VKTIVGRLGKVPEVSVTPQGKSVASFSVAETKRKFDRNSNEWVDDFTIWHNVESWKAPEALAMLTKGTLVIVVGEERDASYESRETGKKVARVVVRAFDVGTVVLANTGPAQTAPAEAWSTPAADWSTPADEEVF
jgi:single-strand DNA-binding protein